MKNIYTYLLPLEKLFVLFFGVLFILLFASGYFFYQRTSTLSDETESLREHVAFLESQFASTTLSLEENIKSTETSLSTKLAEEKQNVEAMKAQFGNVEKKVGTITGTVSTLEKLSKTDPELLQKYSKVFFLNEHYSPDRLTAIPNTYKYFEYKDLKINSSVWPYLERLFKASKSQGVTLYAYSAFRSFEEQSALKGAYTVTYGAGTANTFSADQGYSEHQLGTTLDLITTGIGGKLDNFGNTNAYTWLKQNAHKYGFTLSYPENNEFYVFEPWHWRFVGVKLATHLHNNSMSFYDMDQRDIDEYLVNIFD